MATKQYDQVPRVQKKENQQLSRVIDKHKSSTASVPRVIDKNKSSNASVPRVINKHKSSVVLQQKPPINNIIIEKSQQLESTSSITTSTEYHYNNNEKGITDKFKSKSCSEIQQQQVPRVKMQSRRVPRVPNANINKKASIDANAVPRVNNSRFNPSTNTQAVKEPTSSAEQSHQPQDRNNVTNIQKYPQYVHFNKHSTIRTSDGASDKAKQWQIACENGFGRMISSTAPIRIRLSTESTQELFGFIYQQHQRKNYKIMQPAPASNINNKECAWRTKLHNNISKFWRNYFYYMFIMIGFKMHFIWKYYQCAKSPGSPPGQAKTNYFVYFSCARVCCSMAGNRHHNG